MRLLFVSNLYPPYDIGGYEKHCHEVAARLRARGHDLLVLTSRYGLPGPAREDGVWRTLHLEQGPQGYRPARFFVARRAYERRNAQALQEATVAFRPDVVTFWGMWMLSRRLPALAERGRVPVTYMIEDLWPISVDAHTYFWNVPAGRRWLQPPKRAAARLALALLKREGYPPALQFAHAACGSRYLKERLSQALPAFERAQVITCGIDLQPFHRQPIRTPPQGNLLRAVYLGRLAPEKGVHTAIQSVALLAKSDPHLDLTLTIVGEGPAAYAHRLRALSAELGVADDVRFTGAVPQGEVPAVLGQHDVLVVPSVWEEPFGRVVVEGMAAGLAVVGTATGGSAEILADGVNGLAFPAGDAPALARCLARLARDPALRARLAAWGKATAARYDLSGMVDGLERFLHQVVRANSIQDQD